MRYLTCEEAELALQFLVVPLAPGVALALPHHGQVVAPVPAPVDVEVDLVVLAVHAGVHPGAVLVVPTQHPVLLPPSVVIIPAPASTMMPTSKPSGRFPELVANIGPGTDHGSFLQSLSFTGFPSRAGPGVLVVFLTGAKPPTRGSFPSFRRSVNLYRSPDCKIIQF